MNYTDFLDSKRHSASMSGFDPVWEPSGLFPFQEFLVDWSLRKGRAAIFADCGLGKTVMQLAWAENVVRHTNKPVLVVAPLGVGRQTVHEAAKFDMEAVRSLDGNVGSGARIVVSNYERLHYFDSNSFAGVVCDESSILKNFDGATRSAVTDFMRKTPYRLLCTATAAPNDYIELGTSSEALGELGFMDMIGRFFRKVTSTSSRSDEFRSGTYRFRGHAELDFWRWICSWARAVRKPSDIGFDDGAFVLPRLDVSEHVVSARIKADGFLFDMPAVGLAEQRDERKRTVQERCEMAAQLASHGRATVMWCHLNTEGDLLEKLTPGAVQVSGSDSDERKEEVFEAFEKGEVLKLVTKPTIAGFGLNWQHCAHATFFPSHSFEQWYQSIRRCWRYGQKRNVKVDVVSSEGESGVASNLKRKSDLAESMFANLVSLMSDEMNVRKPTYVSEAVEAPSWM